MPVYFADTSALIKRYIQEIGSDWLIGLFEPDLGNRFYIASTTPVEIIATVTRRALGGATPPNVATATRQRFLADLRTDYQVVPFTEVLMRSAMARAEARALRGFDAVQLATALEVQRLRQQGGLPDLILLSSDLELNAAATAEGLLVEDPNLHP